MSHYDTHLEIGGVDDVPIKVYYEHVRGHAGATDGRHGPKIEPDQPEGIEINWIEDLEGQVIHLTTRQESALAQKIADLI